MWTRRGSSDNDCMYSSGSVPNKPPIPTPVSPTSSLSSESNKDTNRETHHDQVLTGKEAILSQLDVLRGICIKKHINYKLLDMAVPKKNYKKTLSSLNFMGYNNLCGYLNDVDCDQVNKRCCYKIFDINPERRYSTPQMMEHFFKTLVAPSQVKTNTVLNLDETEY